MGDLDRDLLLNVRAEAAQAKSELEGVAASEGKITEQAQAVTVAQQNAAAAMDRLAEASVRGGAEFKAALTEARDAVAELEIALDGVADPAAQAQLAEYDAKIKILTEDTLQAANAHNRLGLEANFARGNIGGLARGLAGIGGPVAELLLPLLLVEAAFKLLPQLYKDIGEAGTKLGEGLYGLATGFKEDGKAVDEHEAKLRKHDEAVHAAQQASDDLLRAKIASAAGLISETNDVHLLTAEWLSYQSRVHEVLELNPQLQKSLEALGFKFKASFDSITGAAQVFVDQYHRVLATQGVAAADDFLKLNKDKLGQLVDAFHAMGASVPPELDVIRKGIEGLFSPAEEAAAKAKELHASLLSLVDDGGRIQASLKAGAEEFGNEKTAILANRQAILDHIGALERLKTANADDEAWRLRQIEQYRKLADTGGLLKTATESLIDARNKERDAISAQITHLDNLTAAYTKERAAVTLRADSEIAQAERARRATESALDSQISALDAAHRAGTISNEEYFSKVNDLQGQEVAARQAARDKEDKIQQDEQAKLTDLETKYKSSSTAIVEDLARQGVGIEAARKIHDTYTKQVADEAKALIDEANKHADSAVKVKEHAAGYVALGGALKQVSDTALPDVGTAVDNVQAKLVSLNGTLQVTITNLRSLEAAATGAAGADEGAGGTPGSEGS